jgi:GrpB-like predicted nucleotidyltransferase (UPF0157 family)
MLGLKNNELKFLNYNPEWQKLFEEEKKLLQSTIGNQFLDIQHIGSTSIPDIIAKPILDIGLAVNNFEAASVCIEPLENIGYSYKGESGIPRRHWFVKGNPTTHHLHILEIDSQNWKNNLIFRDYLRQNSEVAQQYSKLKIKLLDRFKGDAYKQGVRQRNLYQNEKKPFIEWVLQQAKNQ